MPMYVSPAEYAYAMGQVPLPAPVVAPAQAPAPAPPPPVPTGELVRVALDAVMAPMGLPLDRQDLYTRDRLYAIRDEAVRRGVPQLEVNQAVRQEVWRRLLRADPNPGADLEELAVRLVGVPVAPPPPYGYAPAPYAQPYAAPAPAPTPSARRSRGRKSEGQDEPRGGKGRGGQDLMKPALIVGGSLLGAVILMKLFGSST